jgi:quercetin dioxygenase-like cupin family protein
MRRVIASLVVVTFLAIGLFGAAHSPHRVLGQSASPSPDEQAPEGISFEFIAYGQLPANMEPQEGFTMFRLHFKAGSGFPIDKSDPTTALVYVEQGTLTITADTDITVLHAGAGNQEPTEQDFEKMAAGQQFTMTVGDSAVFPAYTSGQVTNAGSDEVVILIAQLKPPGYEEGTPAADDVLATPSG